MCSMNDDPTTYDEFAKTVEETLERMLEEGLIEVKEDDPSVQHEPVTEENIPLTTGDDWLKARQEFPAELNTGDQWLAMRQCSNPDCACKGPSFRSEPVSMGEERRRDWLLRNLHASTNEETRE